VKKYIRNVSYNKRVTDKIRSVCGPLIIGTTKWAEIVVNWRGFEKILGDLSFGGKFREGVHT
jgi:hypothetical protein